MNQKPKFFEKEAGLMVIYVYLLKAFVLEAL